MFNGLIRGIGPAVSRLLPGGLGVSSVPVFELRGARPGKTLLVTGGMDGDEYAGMEAAYELTRRHAGRDFAGTLIVVPVVNVAGFKAECSQNPADGRFPKLVGLGNAGGSPTERLVAWLVDTYAVRADAWMDLHGGAITEGVRPFLWLFETGDRERDLLAQSFAASSGADTVLFERVGPRSKAGELARRGCAYALAESGARGSRDPSDVSRHVAWTEVLMSKLGMLPPAPMPSEPARPPQILRHFRYVTAPFPGIWRPAPVDPSAIVGGAPIGSCVRLDGTGERPMLAPASGVALWWKETMAMREGDILMAVGER